MKSRLLAALAIGVVLSTIFMAIPALRDGTSEWASLGLPGMIVALIVAPYAGNGFDMFILGVFWAVNALVYGLAALIVLGFIRIA